MTISIYSQESNIEILKKTISKLNKIETVFYESAIKCIESGTTYVDRKDSIYFDFRYITGTPKYYLNSKDSELIYDGKRHIQTMVKDKLIVIGGTNNPNNPLTLTLYPIKLLLPKLIIHKNVEISRKKDVVLNKNDNYVFEISLKNNVIDWQKIAINSYPRENPIYNKYTLLINKSTFLPSKLTIPNGPSGTISRTITNVNFDYKVNDKLWEGELLPADYTYLTFDAYMKQMKAKRALLSKKNTDTVINKNIGPWKIPNVKNDKLVDFSKFKGKVVLLEFWFKFCGPCVKAVPQLNAMQQKYKDSNFLLYGIEFREDFSRENLQEYVSKVKIKYPVLYKGKNLANQFSIGSAPTIMILDKKGNIIYLKSGFRQAEIEKIIKENI